MAARPRTELQEMLEELLGKDSHYVQFQPSESFKLKYPCILYELSGIKSDKADNIKYRTDKRYTVTLIDRNPDSEFVDKLYALDYCSFDRFFAADNLNHWVFTLYW